MAQARRMTRCVFVYQDLSLGEPVRAAAEERNTLEKRIFPREVRQLPHSNSN
jgi:hypothetical protein